MMEPGTAGTPCPELMLIGFLLWNEAQLCNWWVQQPVSICYCSTGSLAGLCEDRSRKAEWREEPVRQLALGSVTLPALMDGQ